MPLVNISLTKGRSTLHKAEISAVETVVTPVFFFEEGNRINYCSILLDIEGFILICVGNFYNYRVLNAENAENIRSAGLYGEKMYRLGWKAGKYFTGKKITAYRT